MPKFELPIIADNHLHEWKEFSQIVDGVNDRLLDGLEPWYVVADWFRQNPDMRLGINAGDTFHQRNVQRTVVGSRFYEAFTDLYCNNDLDVRWGMIPGNHDQSTRSGEVHSLYPLGPVADVHAAPTGTRVGEYEIDFLPYADKPEDVRAGLRSFQQRRRSTRRKILVGHVGVAGAVTGSFEFVPAEQITVRDFPAQYDAVLLGHYHKRQVLQEAGEKQPLVMYCGAPLQHTRDDYKEDRGVLVFDVESLKSKVLRLPRAPRFVRIPAGTIGTTEAARQAHKNFVYLQHGPSDDLERCLKTLSGYNVRGVKPVLVAAEGSGTKGMLRRGAIDARHLSDEDLVAAYAEKHARQADTERLTRLGVDLLHEASEES